MFPNVILADMHTGVHVAEMICLVLQMENGLSLNVSRGVDATHSELDALRRILDRIGVASYSSFARAQLPKSATG